MQYFLLNFLVSDEIISGSYGEEKIMFWSHSIAIHVVCKIYFSRFYCIFQVFYSMFFTNFSLYQQIKKNIVQ